MPVRTGKPVSAWIERASAAWRGGVGDVRRDAGLVDVENLHEEAAQALAHLHASAAQPVIPEEDIQDNPDDRQAEQEKQPCQGRVHRQLAVQQTYRCKDRKGKVHEKRYGTEKRNHVSSLTVRVALPCPV